MKSRSIAILIDGGFFLKRLPKLVTPQRCATPERIAGCIRHLCQNHVKALTGSEHNNWNRHVYRIFYYDALPYDGKSHHPIENKPIDFAKSNVALQRRALFDCLKKQRKFALRLGKVNLEQDWTIRPDLGKKLLHNRASLQALKNAPQEQDDQGQISVTLSQDEYDKLLNMNALWEQLTPRHVSLGLRQKGVDMRIGIDIASLALKKQVETIILVAGDSDFVPAAKLARREGIDFILDPLWQNVNADLFEHIDGLQSGLSKPGHPKKPQSQPNNAATTQ